MGGEDLEGQRQLEGIDAARICYLDEILDLVTRPNVVGKASNHSWAIPDFGPVVIQPVASTRLSPTRRRIFQMPASLSRTK